MKTNELCGRRWNNSHLPPWRVRTASSVLLRWSTAVCLAEKYLIWLSVINSLAQMLRYSSILWESWKSFHSTFAEAAFRRELFCRSIPIYRFFRFRMTRGPIRWSAPPLEVHWQHSEWPKDQDLARSV